MVSVSQVIESNVGARSGKDGVKLYFGVQRQGDGLQVPQIREAHLLAGAGWCVTHRLGDRLPIEGRSDSRQ
ncbi:MAG: hypothetical protein MI861_12015 [Pirellulales bacterium]|nr:hypothetical protein [Pirellulales bacterium]